MRLVFAFMIAPVLFAGTASAATPTLGSMPTDRGGLAAIGAPAAAIRGPAALVSQLPDLSPGGTLVSSEVIAMFGLVTEAADDFVLPGTPGTPIQLTDIRWWGGYWNMASPSDPHVTGFKLAIYDDAGCIAGSEVAEINVEGNAAETYVGELAPDNPLYAYSTPVAVELQAGTHYWLSIQAGDHLFPPEWGRLSAAEGVLACDGLFRSAYYGFPNWTPLIDVYGVPLDLSYEINGAPVQACAGLPQYHLGAATLATDGDSLVISGIGASGEDGVGIALDDFTGLEFLFGGEGLHFDAVADSGAELNLTLNFAVPQGALLKQGDPIRGVDINLGKCPCIPCPCPRVVVSHTVDFSDLGATAESLVIVNHGVAQYRALVPNGTGVNVYESDVLRKAISEKGVQVISDWNGDGALDSTYTGVAFQFTDPFPMEVDGVPYTGDRIIFSRHTGLSTGEITELRLRGTAPLPGSTIHTITLKDIRPIALGGLFATTGGSMFDALPEVPAPLTVLAPAGGGDLLFTQGGPIAGEYLAVTPPPAGPIPIPYPNLGMSMADPDSGGVLAPGAALTIAAVGVVAGVPDLPLGWCTFEMLPVALLSPAIRVVASFADLGATVKRLEVRNGGTLIHTVTTASDDVATAAVFPTASRYDIAATQGSQAGYVFHWATPITIRVLGVDYTADELRVGMEGAGLATVTSPSGVANLSYRGVGIPGITFTSTTYAQVATSVYEPAELASPAQPLRLAVWPNPGAAGVQMRVSAPAGARLTMDIYDVSGRHVRTLASGAVTSGDRSLSWDARSDAGAPVSPGIYFVRGTIDVPRSGARSQTVEGQFVIVR